ncbi:type II toxin-antitoxin system RelE/ParE family toxin [Nitrospirillum iridis]|uniref:type II toxin-antitoxin system RelE/ParE family toxin n=1 Tax=Nitrospirillum iridis TaxID=765888 RepID=UPI002483301E|nr:type II toxin-antitoxin system RelE/ParE family toxin [Nitrospirillum iridis]
MRYRLTSKAAVDIAEVLRHSERMFGPTQRHRYAALIHKAITMVAAEPDRPGSRSRPEIRPGLRSLHIEYAAGRRGAASHLLYYRVGSEEIIVLRLLHEAMDASRHFPAMME